MPSGQFGDVINSLTGFAMTIVVGEIRAYIRPLVTSAHCVALMVLAALLAAAVQSGATQRYQWLKE